MYQSSRKWNITMENPSIEETEEFKKLPYDFKCYEIKETEENTKILKGYIQNRTSIRYNTIKNKIPRAQIERTKGSIQQNIDQIETKDDGIYEEIGTIPKPIRKRKEFEFKPLNLNEVIEMGKRDCSKKTINNINAQREFYGIQLETKVAKEILEDRLQKPKVIYIYGASGTGKTYSAWKYAIQNYGNGNITEISFTNGYAICSNPHAKCIIYDAIKPSQTNITKILTLMDGYGMNMKIKHRSIFIRPECVIITSIKHPEEVYTEEINQQLKHRITQFINMNENPWKQNEKEEVEEIHFNEDKKMEEERTNEKTSM